MRSESGDFDVVAQDVWILRYFVILAGEELLLIVEAGPPGEIRADFQVFALNLADHIDGVHAFGVIRVVGTAGGVNVMIAGPPPRLGRIDPALKIDLFRLRL